MRDMRDSGVKWIGEIPSLWKIARVKNVAKGMQSGGTPDSSNDGFYVDAENGIPWVAIGDMSTTPYVQTTAKCISEEGRRSKNLAIFSPGTILYAMYASVGKIAELSIPATINQALLAIELRETVNSEFFKYALNAWEPYIISESNGTTQFNLNANKVANLCFPFPDIAEQAVVAKYLNLKCGQVDALIANVQAQIEKLKAYKQSLITEVVTKGLDPTVPMKDSELLWFGNIPQHWKLAKVKLFASTCSGGTPPSGDMSYYDGDVNWVCSYDLHETEITETGKTLSEKGAALIAGELQSPNSILIAMYGGSGTIGNSGLLKCYARTNQAICSVHFDEAAMDPRFAFYQTMFIRKYWMYYAVGTRKDPNISQDVVRNMKYVIPPIDEQKSMVVLLDEKCSQIDRLITLKEAKIEKLEQYKKSLIYEYVTGKKEVH